MAFRVFIDTDVVISSLISKTGAAFLLLNETDNLKLFISNISIKEQKKVVGRLHLDAAKLELFIKEKFTEVQLKESIKDLQVNFNNFVLDVDDAHILAGAKQSKAQFLISYNTRHFRIDKIKSDLNIIVITPANFLQYLRGI